MDIRLRLGIEKGRGFFRLNSRVLEDPGIKEWVESRMESWKDALCHFESTAHRLDGGLAITSGILDVCSRILARARNRKEAECIRRIEEAEERMGRHPISARVWAAERVKRMAEWDKLQEDKQRRWLEILQEKGIETNDKMSKETFQKLQPRRLQQQMIELKHPFDESAPTACSAAGMLQYANLYYADILTTRQPNEDVDTDLSAQSDMWTDTTVKLSTAAVLDLDRHVTLEELTQTVKSMAKGKSPGIDRLTVEFYSTNWKGCPLAPLVFVLQLEVLLNRIRRNPDIRGLQVHGEEECMVKVLADDLFATASDLRRASGRQTGRREAAIAQALMDVHSSPGLWDAPFLLSNAIVAGVMPRETPRWWVKRRTGGTWRDLTIADDASDDYFHDKMRMTRTVFNDIVAACSPFIQCRLTHYREALQPDHIVAYMLYWWASGETFESGTSSFGIGRSSGITTVNDVTNAILAAYPDKIAIPTGRRLLQVLRAFSGKGSPNCFGAIDCTHIYVDKPANAPSENYFNCKQQFSVVAQVVVVDLDMRIINVFVGYPGCVHYQHVLRNSSLLRRAEGGDI
ncbi:hypothetical protein CBR_g6528 [Chara braunii]|uniref:DDE Tnp4 domain-containing protein n=1 Tax=Chara braunii TaxID=69332 RepID=A0A388KK13_CHABU|nr:hypothetical protein CBR_g6528 [Chara braunii]|eukprot:GBG70400.1 hypothetical protein CBR_g6528 [Chara braunii]